MSDLAAGLERVIREHCIATMQAHTDEDLKALDTRSLVSRAHERDGATRAELRR